MSEWTTVFDIWESYSPFLNRNLVSRKGLFNWAEELGYVKYKTEINDCYYLLDYLEENNLFQPIFITKADSEYGQKLDRRGRFRFFPDDPREKDFIKFYHPFQFFQFILFWDSFKKYYSKESEFYYYSQKKYIINEIEGKKRKKWLRKIENEEKKWIKSKNTKLYKSFNKNVKNSKERTFRQKRQQIRKNNRNLKQAIKNKKVYDNLYPQLAGSHWLSSDFLKVWIKLDSLMLFREYIITPSGVNIYPRLNTKSQFDKNEREEVLAKFKNWTNEKLNDKRHFLTQGEQDILKKMYDRIYHHFIHSSKNKINGLESLENLLDLIPKNKLSKLYGNLNISVNILALLRNLTRVTWELFEFNLIIWPKNKEKEQPYFYLNNESEAIEFRGSVLADFGLFVSTPFVLYTEGGTEKTLMKYYFDNKWLLFPISVENIGGIDKTIQALTINRPLKDRIYFFFLDYERPQKYSEKKGKIGDHGAFFYPDFVTENFEPDAILDLYDKWLNNLGTTFKESQRNSLLSELKRSKDESNGLIALEDKTLNIKGYEKILIDFSLRNFQANLMKAYPEIVIGKDHPYPSKKKFRQTFKKFFTEEYLIIPIKERLEKDPERKNEKFAFEMKLKPFYDAINQYRLRNEKIQYDLKI